MRKTRFAEGEFYHLYNRGVDKKIIFSEPNDYKRFIAYLYLLNTQDTLRPSDMFDVYDEGEILQLPQENPLVAIGAYCLMPNHFHVYATPLIDEGISKFMQRLQTGYTMFFNQRRERSGALFQGTFKARHVDRDSYAKYLFSYIHLNPAKLIDPDWQSLDARDFIRLRDHVSSYPYSSIGEYITGEHILTDPSKFPRYFTTRKDVDEHIDMWLQFRTGSADFLPRPKKRGRRRHAKILPVRGT